MVDGQAGPTNAEVAVQVGIANVALHVAQELRMTDGEAQAWRLLHAAPDPVIVMNADGIIELINAQAVLLFGYEADELIGSPVEVLVPAARHDAHRRHRAAYIASDQPNPMSTGPDVVAVRKDGRTVPIEVNLSSITLSTGRAVLASVRDVTESRELQRELAAARDGFRDVLNGATEQAIFATDPQGRITVVSEGARRMSGYAEEALLGQSPEMLHDHDEIIARADELRLPAGFEVLVARARRRGADIREWSYRRASGDVLTVLLTVTATFDSAGELTGYIFVASDITARKRAEDQLRVSEEGLRVTFAAAPIGMTLTSMTAGTAGQVLRVNRAMCELTGRSEAELLVQDLTNIVHSDDLELVERLLRLQLRGEVEHADFEIRCVHLSGRDIWVSLATSLVQDADGEPLYTVSHWEDITHRKHTETQLEERFRELATNVDAGFALRQVDPPQYLYVNPAFLSMFGFDPDDPMPTPAHTLSLVHPDDLFRVGTILGAPSGSHRVEQEWRFIRPNGEQHWVLGRISPIVDDDGRIRRVAGVFEDITDRKAAEVAVRAARAEAERANAAKDVFLSRLSHELRTPLNAVLGFAQLLELDPLNGDQGQAVGHILRGGRHLLSMIDDILDITGIEADRLEISLEPVGITELIHDTMGLMQPLAAGRRVTVHFDRRQPAAGRYVRADRRRLRQVLLNLLSNAINYNRANGRVDITVTTTDERHLSVAVIDTGAGIAAADLPRLFSPFDRLGRESSEIDGTGIGLLLSQRLTTLMDGRIDVETRAGHGSTFTVTMPLAATPALQAAPSREHREPSRAVITLATLLYIEDNPSNVDLLTSVLRRRPTWAMTHAATGAEGLELARTATPRVILLDLHLPDMDGMDVLRTLKANPVTATIPIGILSADASPNQVGRLLAAGAQLYLTKPFDLHELFAFLDSHAA